MVENNSELSRRGIVRWVDGSREWYLNGQLHREDGPAIEWANGSKTWYVNGQLHRRDGPAVEWANGTREWYLNGELHREDGPAIEYADGSGEWYVNGKCEVVSNSGVSKELLNQLKDDFTSVLKCLEGDFSYDQASEAKRIIKNSVIWKK